MSLSTGSMLERLFWEQLRGEGLERECVREHTFAPPRRWRFDFSWTKQLIAVEIEGGSWVNGAHNRGEHFESDCEKYARALILSWRVLRVTGAQVNDGRALAWLGELMAAHV